MNPFKDAFKDCTRKFTQPLSRTPVSCRLEVSKLYKLPFRNTICGSKFWQIFRVFIFAYDETLSLVSQIFLAFAISALLISNVLMELKEEPFMTKIPIKHVYNRE